MTFPIDLAVQEHPERLAFTDGEVQLTYAQLAEAISSSKPMQLEQVKPGDHVAWCPRNSLNDFLTFWALQKRGLVTCPISHRFPKSKRAEILEQIDAHWLPELVEQTTKNSSTAQEFKTDSHCPATLILSSGSTGAPKAVVHNMAAHIASAKGAATNMPLNVGDRWLWSLPLFHISGLSILVRCAVAGATVAGMPTNARLGAKLLDDLQVTHLSVVTTQLRQLLAEEEFPSPHLKWVLLGGSSVDPKLVISARKRGVNVMTSYGLTETASQVYTSNSGGDPSSRGQVLPGRQLKISESGEILVRGETLCLGYYHSGKIHPVVDEQGWFHTKDLGELDENEQLTVNGRIDNMFVSGGENIHPENIERVMMRAFELQQVVVVPKPDADFGARPIAFIQGSLPENWQATLRTSLKGYEIPIETRAWPAEIEESMKVNRKYFLELI